MAKVKSRTKSVTTKVTEEEYTRLEDLAAKSGLNVSEWIRGNLWNIGRPDCDSEVLLGELLALRGVLLNLLFCIANGETVTAEQMQLFIERAEKNKIRRVLERISSTPTPTEVDRQREI
jgi:hypothetical protein